MTELMRKSQQHRQIYNNNKRSKTYQTNAMAKASESPQGSPFYQEQNHPQRSIDQVLDCVKKVSSNWHILLVFVSFL